MTKPQSYIPLSAFATSTRFAIQPRRAPVLGSGHCRGCIEVHLLNHDGKRVPAGGDGLVFSGSIPFLRERCDLLERLALVDGYNEVFEVATFYDNCVVLRPLDKGLGVHYEHFRSYAGRTSQKSRLRKKYATKASQSLEAMRQRIRQLTGSARQSTGPVCPFVLREIIDRTWETTDHALPAITIEDAKTLARARIAELRCQGWKCGQESCFHGRIENGWGREDETTVAWLCQRGDKAMRISVEKVFTR